MMKFFYAVQATGNGHISRANAIVPLLQQYGDVDIFLSGNNSALKTSMPVAYRSKGISLPHSGNCAVNTATSGVLPATDGLTAGMMGFVHFLQALFGNQGINLGGGDVGMAQE